MKDARQVNIRNYNEAQRRMVGIAPQKLAKLSLKIFSLYDRIVLGPASLPSAPTGSGSAHAMPPHWRRDYFRMHAHGAGYSQSKLLFIAPVLVHADRLVEVEKEVPQPKTYRVGR